MAGEHVHHGPLEGWIQPSRSTWPKAGHELVYADVFSLSHHCPLKIEEGPQNPSERTFDGTTAGEEPEEPRDQGSPGQGGPHCFSRRATSKSTLLPEMKRGARPGLGSQSTFPAKAHIQIQKISRGEDKLLCLHVSFWKLFMVSPYQQQLWRARSEMFLSEGTGVLLLLAMATVWLGQTKSLH